MSGPGIPNYLDYPWRRRGLDHDRFLHRNLPQAKPIVWPGKARVALWVAVHVAEFPMDMPRHAVRGAGRRRPALSELLGLYPARLRQPGRHLSPDAGARSARPARDGADERARSRRAIPRSPKEIAASRWEVAAAGLDMGHLHHGGLSEAEERALVKQAVGALRGAFASKIRGWHSPAHSESMRTLDLVAEAGLDYVTDWINDDMPYPVTTSAGALTAMPLAWDMSDQRLLFQQHMDTDEFIDQVKRAFATLYAEAAAPAAAASSRSPSRPG